MSAPDPAVEAVRRTSPGWDWLADDPGPRTLSDEESASEERRDLVGEIALAVLVCVWLAVMVGLALVVL